MNRRFARVVAALILLWLTFFAPGVWRPSGAVADPALEWHRPEDRPDGARGDTRILVGLTGGRPVVAGQERLYIPSPIRVNLECRLPSKGLKSVRWVAISGLPGEWYGKQVSIEISNAGDHEFELIALFDTVEGIPLEVRRTLRLTALAVEPSAVQVHIRYPGAEVSPPVDINGDFRVDEADIDRLWRTYGSTRNAAGYTPLADWNGNGEIELEDLVRFLDAYPGWVGRDVGPTYGNGLILPVTDGENENEHAFQIPTPLLRAVTEPPGLETWIEWRLEGSLLGTGPILKQPLPVGTRVIRANFLSLGKDDTRTLTIYRTTIWDSQSNRALQTDSDILEDGVEYVLESRTEPPGFEDYVTWYAATKFGSVTPSRFRGRTFRVTFKDTWGSDSRWLGIQADDGYFNLDEKNPMPCMVSSITGAGCLCKDRTLTYSATGSPGGGTYSWAVIAGGTRAAIVGPTNLSTVQVRGNATSVAAGDVSLRVTYTPPAQTACSSTRTLTVIDTDLTFRATGTWDAQNGVTQVPSMGDPTLGGVAPGNPASCTGYYKNMQIKATIMPCVNGLGCTYDLKRERQGYVGVVRGGLFTPDALNCPSPAWCNDDNSNADEDLVLDPPPACTVFVVDNPGWATGGNGCNPPQQAGDILVNSLNFREWLQVDGQPCSDSLLWHASTRIECNGGNNMWALNGAGAGNVIGEGNLILVAPPPAPDVFPYSETRLDIVEAIELIRSEDMVERLQGQNRVLVALGDGIIAGDDRSSLVRGLVEVAGTEAPEYPIWSSQMLAIRLLGHLGTEAALTVLFDRLLVDFPRPVVSDRDRPPATVAGNALADLGAISIGPILDRVRFASDSEWNVLKSALEQMDPASTGTAVHDRLTDESNPVTRDRLQEILQH